jgi:hypothetical protein
MRNGFVKEFLRPTWLKFLFFILLMIFVVSYSCFDLFRLGCIQAGCIMKDGILSCSSCGVCHARDIMPFSLLFVIPNYLLSCFIVGLIKRNKKMK